MASIVWQNIPIEEVNPQYHIGIYSHYIYTRVDHTRGFWRGRTRRPLTPWVDLTTS